MMNAPCIGMGGGGGGILCVRLSRRKVKDTNAGFVLFCSSDTDSFVHLNSV